eukprot:CAMPEP_0119002834 /NCGR_PEP_ID=MMETSP1176-20130426/159_1 /TAXON_ID=265551 /ORGANISM="Synedropsis recta cf, Strain CCMP1620" /LENGTH=223 /DNA_ID=CAMNT_0006954363 /DNA_START=96 /DNA_END=767 /DNA_ORIENTATION=-
MARFVLAFLALVVSTSAFAPQPSLRLTTPLKGAESEVSFSADLDGSDVRVGIIRTRWNDEHVSNLVGGMRKALGECNVEEDNIFETEVPGAYELPLAAKLLAMSGTVDAIITTGVLIKGDTMHFEYICDAVSTGLMTVGLATSTPVIFGVLTCLDEQQVISRSAGDSNHGYDWGKTAVEMALLKNEAMGQGSAGNKKGKVGFSTGDDDEKDTKKVDKVIPGFF